VDEATVLDEATATKSLGITVFTIGLGQDVNGPLLQQIASSPSHYYFAPSTAELIDIYERIAGAIRCPDK